MQLFNAWRGTVHNSHADDLPKLKEQISQDESIEPTNLLCLVAPQGHQLRDLQSERVFIYDKSWAVSRPADSEVSAPTSKNSDGSENLAGPDASDLSQKTDSEGPEVSIVLEGTQLVYNHMRNNLDVVARQLKKLKHAKSQLEDDVHACANWKKYYDAMQQIPALSGELAQLLDLQEIQESYSTLTSVWSNLKRTLVELTKIFDSLTESAHKWPKESDLQTELQKRPNINSARDMLASTLQSASQFQLQIVTNLRKPLSILNDDLKHAENLKSKVAKVIDLPFLYGVLLIESSRRSKWDADIGPILRRESDRREGWHKFYCQGSLGPLVKRLDLIGKFYMATSSSTSNTPSASNRASVSTISGEDISGGDRNSAEDDSKNRDKTTKPKDHGPNSGLDNARMVGFQEVADYLTKLDDLDLEDVSKDLRGELGAMKRQFAKSMSASISSLMPQSIMSPRRTISLSPAPLDSHSRHPSSLNASTSEHNADNGIISINSGGSGDTNEHTVAAYESRVRKLETLLMQARLGSKSHELDIIRAETRAEARAEARAEVHAEKLQAKIEELESRNRELSGRLSRYTDGLEVVLNSMGLQTSRVDPDTGNNIYRVNRVKGLSRRVSPPLPESRGSTESMSGGTNSNHEVDTPSSSLVDSARTNVSIERFLDQTFVDNHVLFEAVNKRFGDVERLARKLQVENRRMRETQVKYERDLRQRVALHSFGPEDLILFLPTRDPRRQPNPWAAFNAAAPHYFLHPKHAEQLKNREYLIARASAIEKHVVESNSDASENPFDLPVGVEWYLISIHGEWGV